MSKKKKSQPPAEDGLAMLTVRLRPSIIKRTKLAATLLELPVQTVVSIALDEWLTGHESRDQGTLLLRYARLRKEGKR